MSSTSNENPVYKQDILIVFGEDYYHIPAATWKSMEKYKVSENDRVKHLVVNGAAAASIPEVPGETDLTIMPPATCFLLNLDVMKGGY